MLPQDGKPPPTPGQDGPEEREDAPKEAVLVVDVDSAPMAEQVLLQLILARAKLKALVSDTSAASTGFGPYAEILGGGSSDAAALRRAMRGVLAVVLCGRVTPAVVAAAAAAGVPHLVLLSAVGAPQRGGFAFFGGGEMATLGDASREAQVVSSGIKYTIVRVGALTDAEGGAAALQLEGGQGPGGTVSREDAALVLAQAATRDAAGSVACRLGAGGVGAPPADWAAVFAGLREKAVS